MFSFGAPTVYFLVIIMLELILVMANRWLE